MIRLEADAALVAIHHRLANCDVSDLVAAVRTIGFDPAYFFEFGDWDDIDLRGSDLAGVSFRGARMKRIWVYDDQVQAITETQPAWFLEPRLFLRTAEAEASECDDAADRQHREAYEKAKHRIAEAARNGSIKLSLSITGLTKIPPLGGFTALQWLGLQQTRVSDLSPLARLTALQWLDLQQTKVSDLSPLAGLTALRWLYLEQTQVSDLSPLAGLTALRWLNLRQTQASDLSPLAGLVALKGLYLEKTRVNDLSPLSHLTSLRIIRSG